MISDQIDIFLSINKTADTSAYVLWEKLKAYIRGQNFFFVRYKRKQKREKFDALTIRITQVDTFYAFSPSPDLYKECVFLLAEFDTLTVLQTTLLSYFLSPEVLFMNKATKLARY